MVTSADHLLGVKAGRANELESIFEAVIGNGSSFTYAGSPVTIVGGRSTLSDLKEIRDYYKRKGVVTCYIRDGVHNVNLAGTPVELDALIDSISDWGVDQYVKLMKKQACINNCTSTDQVMDITWDSTEWESM